MKNNLHKGYIYIQIIFPRAYTISFLNILTFHLQFWHRGKKNQLKKHPKTKTPETNPKSNEQ